MKTRRTKPNNSFDGTTTHNEALIDDHDEILPDAPLTTLDRADKPHTQNTDDMDYLLDLDDWSTNQNNPYPRESEAVSYTFEDAMQVADEIEQSRKNRGPPVNFDDVEEISTKLIDSDRLRSISIEKHRRSGVLESFISEVVHTSPAAGGEKTEVLINNEEKEEITKTKRKKRISKDETEKEEHEKSNKIMGEYYKIALLMEKEPPKYADLLEFMEGHNIIEDTNRFSIINIGVCIKRTEIPTEERILNIEPHILEAIGEPTEYRKKTMTKSDFTVFNYTNLSYWYKYGFMDTSDSLGDIDNLKQLGLRIDYNTTESFEFKCPEELTLTYGMVRYRYQTINRLIEKVLYSSKHCGLTGLALDSFALRLDVSTHHFNGLDTLQRSRMWDDSFSKPLKEIDYTLKDKISSMVIGVTDMDERVERILKLHFPNYKKRNKHFDVTPLFNLIMKEIGPDIISIVGMDPYKSDVSEEFKNILRYQYSANPLFGIPYMKDNILEIIESSDSNQNELVENLMQSFGFNVSDQILFDHPTIEVLSVQLPQRFVDFLSSRRWCRISRKVDAIYGKIAMVMLYLVTETTKKGTTMKNISEHLDSKDNVRDLFEKSFNRGCSMVYLFKDTMSLYYFQITLALLSCWEWGDFKPFLTGSYDHIMEEVKKIEAIGRSVASNLYVGLISSYTQSILSGINLTNR